MGNVQERMQKKIDKREKYYAKLEKQLERQATAYKNYATNNMNSIFTSGFDPSGIYSGQSAIGTSAIQQQAMQAACSKYGCDLETLANWIQNGGSIAYSAATGNEAKTKLEEKVFKDALGNEITGVQYAALQNASRFVQQYQSQMTTQIQNMKTAYQEQVDQWLEIAKEQLEGQKEWEMDLLEEEQSDMEAEKTSVEAQLSLAEERKKAIEERLGQAIQDSAPKFGLA